MNREIEELIDCLLDSAASCGCSDAVKKFEELRKNGQILFVPYGKDNYCWHIYPMSKTDPKKGYTKRLVSYEQMVAGLAKDPNGIYVRFRNEADKKIEELKNAVGNN